MTPAEVLATFRATPAPEVGEDPGLDALATAVCQLGGHIPNRDRSLPGSCDFHRRMAWAYVSIIDGVRRGQ